MFAEFSKDASNFDSILYKLLSYIENLYGFYYTQVGLIAKICFLLTLGIGAIKLIFGGTELHKFFVQMLMALMTYFVMIWAYPYLMMGVVNITTEFAYRSVNGQEGINRSVKSNYGGNYEQFVEWVMAIGDKQYLSFYERLIDAFDGINYYDSIHGKNEGYRRNEKGKVYKIVNSIWDDKTWGSNRKKAVENFLNVNITTTLEGNNKEDVFIISPNKIFQYLVVIFRVVYIHVKEMTSYVNMVTNSIGFFDNLLEIVVALIVLILITLANIFAVIEYFLCLVYWCFLYGLGVIFIPFMLWDGSRHAFEKLCGSMFSIAVRMLITNTILYLMILIEVSMLVQMYYLQGGDKSIREIGTVGGIEYYLFMIVCEFFMIFLIRNAAQIGEYLCGGQPGLGFREMSQAGKSTAAAGVMGAGTAVLAGKTAANVGTMLAGGVLNLQSVVGAGRSAAALEGRGAGIGAFMTSAIRGGINQLAATGGSIGKDLKNFGGGMAQNVNMAINGTGGLRNGLSLGLGKTGSKKTDADKLQSGDAITRLSGAAGITGDSFMKGASAGDAMREGKAQFGRAQGEKNRGNFRGSVNTQDKAVAAKGEGQDQKNESTTGIPGGGT